MAQDWDIKTRGEACHGCSVPFAEEAPYWSCLTFGEAGYSRHDYCPACRDALAVPEGRFSLWQGVYRNAKAPPREALRKETAETLLRRLMEERDPGHAQVMFILAVMLERKRILVERGTQKTDEDTLIRVYEHRQTQETFLVPDPRLKLDDLRSVQAEVLALLNAHENHTPSAGPAPEVSAAAAAPSESATGRPLRDGFFSSDAG